MLFVLLILFSPSHSIPIRKKSLYFVPKCPSQRPFFPPAKFSQKRKVRVVKSWKMDFRNRRIFVRILFCCCCRRCDARQGSEIGELEGRKEGRLVARNKGYERKGRLSLGFLFTLSVGEICRGTASSSPFPWRGRSVVRGMILQSILYAVERELVSILG